MSLDTAEKVADFVMLRVVPVALVSALLFPVVGGLGFERAAHALVLIACLCMVLALAGVLVVVIETVTSEVGR